MHCLCSSSVAYLKSLWEGHLKEEIPEELWEDVVYTPRHQPVQDAVYTTQCRRIKVYPGFVMVLNQYGFV